MKIHPTNILKNSKINQQVSRIPLDLDVPFAALLIGLRPSRLPPLPEGFNGISIGYIEPRNWADRAGLQVGDVITHVNGKSVVGMILPSEFTEPTKNRPLRLTVEVSVPLSEISRLLGNFDWSSRLYEVGKVRAAKVGNVDETNEMFERVFSAHEEEKNRESALFDYSKWVGAEELSTSPPPENEPVSPTGVVPQIAIPTEPLAIGSVISDSNVARRVSVPKVPRRIIQRTESTWTPSTPISVFVQIHQGFNLPEKAGTLDSNSLFQPFSSDPFVEIFLCLASSSEMSIQALSDCKPIEASAQSQTGICDATHVWNHSAKLSVSSARLSVEDLILVGKLWDYRRLSAAKLMGLFAIPVGAVDVSSNPTKPKSVTLTSVNSVCFELSKSKIKLSMHVLGTQTTASSSTSSEKGTSLAGSPVPVDSIGGQENAPVDMPPEPLKVEVVKPEAGSPFRSPFERALAQARSDIQQGDFSPLRLQAYTLR